uniref:C-type lectin domain-containing protein n=1 Tax=Panagrolaimus sp. ES5 TaxID=591445 RepID=A0AC34G6B4_9BILA
MKKNEEVFAAALINMTAFSCPNGSLEWKSNCYIFHPTETGFATAETICVKNGGHLVSIHDAFLNNLIGDGSTFDFNDWNKGEPKKTSDSNCASASTTDGYWNTKSCFNRLPFVCGIFNQSTTTAEPTVSTLSILSTTIPETVPTSSPLKYPIITNCSLGWTYFEYTKSSYCVNLDVAKNWQDGETYCHNLGGHLASVHNYEEKEFISATVCFSEESVWIGLHTVDNGTTWQWTDNSPVDYLYWEPGYPHLTRGDCVAETSYCIKDSGLFYNLPCDNHRPTVCKKTK